MFYSYIQPMLFGIKEEEKNNEMRIAGIIINLTLETYSCLNGQNNPDILYIAVFPEYTFRKNTQIVLEKNEVTEIQEVMQNSLNKYHNLLVIAGTVLWKDENNLIYNSTLLFQGNKTYVWDKLFPHSSDYANMLDLARWVPENENINFGNMIYRINKKDNLVYHIDIQEDQTQVILYSYETPGIQGTRVIYVEPITTDAVSAKKILYNKILQEHILPYTIKNRLPVSSLGINMPLFSLSDTNQPVLALDICRDNVLKVAKYYCDSDIIKKGGLNSINLFVLIASGRTWDPHYVPNSASIVIQCDIQGNICQFKCIDLRKQSGNRECGEENYIRLKENYDLKHKIYRPIPLCI